MNSTKTRTLLPLALLCSVLLLGVIGCSKSGTITGKVTYDGKPVTVGIIQFIPEKGRAVSADIAEGEYTAKGVPAGPCTVTVSTADAEKTAKALPKGNQAGPSALPSSTGGQQGPNIKDKMKDKGTADMPGTQELQDKQKENEKFSRLVPVPPQYGELEQAKKNPDQNFTVQSGKQEFNLDLQKVGSGDQKPKK